MVIYQCTSCVLGHDVVGIAVGFAVSKVSPLSNSESFPVFSLLNSSAMTDGLMTAQRLTGLLEETSEIQEQREGFWNVDYLDRNLLLVNKPVDLLRIMTPILPAEDVDVAILFQVLQANFERTRNARYALHGDYLWATFGYTFAALTESEITTAMDQVTLLADTFGATFSASLLPFGDTC